MPHKRLSRNAPCPCGSDKKYKHWCYGKGVEDDPGVSSARQPPQYPSVPWPCTAPATGRPRRSPPA
jgi:hypothetical protein